MTVLEKLTASRDEEYRGFQVKLVPNIDPERIIGVRTPELRRIAKEALKEPGKDAFLNDLPHGTYEEDLVHFFIIAGIRDFDDCVREVERFLPYVDCWPVSDQATPASFRKNHGKFLPYIRKWIGSEHVYTARFGLRMLMNEFLGADFRKEFLDLAASAKGDDYYLRMMVAWFFATALAKRYDETLPYIEERRLDEWVRRKAIQKALESFRVTEEHKEHLRRCR